MYEEAVAIFKGLASKEGMANSYCNMGIVYAKRGDLGKARLK